MSLIAELKRRKVFKIGAAYLVVGWLLIQIASTVAPQLNLPEWAPRLITFLILLGFPIALVLAWSLDVTPEGIRVETAPAGNKRVLGVAIVLAALAVGWYWRSRPQADAGDPGTHSIAVLPFVNMSDDASNEFFSDGISEEILNVLARMPGLHVAARTSSFSFRKQEKEIPTIARDLKVRMVLEGSVRKQAERVRVTAQLIDASNGYHVWSQTYDRDLKDIFAIQDEIAGAIASELKIKLDAAHAPAGETVEETKDLSAYQFYLKATQAWAARSDKNLRQAEALFEAAIRRDPKYAKAWAGLALTYAILPEWSGDITTGEAYLRGRNAAERALALNPNLPEGYAALAYIAGVETRFPTAHVLFERAIAFSPSYATAYQWYGEVLQQEGDLEHGMKMVEKARELDPKSSIVNSVYAAMLYVGAHDGEAVAVCDAIVAIEEDWCPLIRFDVALASGDHAKARAALEQAAAKRGPEALALFHAQMDVLDGKADAAAVAERLMDAPDGQIDPHGITPMSAADVVLWLMKAGRNDLAIERMARYQKVLPSLVRIAAFDPHLAALHCEPRYIEILRAAKVEEPHLTEACPKKS